MPSLIDILAVIGLLCWLGAMFGLSSPLPDNFHKSPLAWAIVYPVLGFIFLAAGIIMLAPIAWLFHWPWFYAIFG